MAPKRVRDPRVAGRRVLPGDPSESLWKDGPQKAEKYRKRVEQLRNLFDEEKRPVTLVDLSLEWLPKLLDKVLGLEKPMSVGIYLKPYEAHFSILREVVRTASTRRAIDKQGEKIRETASALLKAGESLERRFQRGGPEWLDLQARLAERRYYRQLHGNTLEHYGFIPPAVDFATPLRAVNDRLDESFAELSCEYVAVRGIAEVVFRQDAQREQKLEQLRASNTLGTVAAQTARRDDTLEDLHLGTPVQRVRRLLGRLDSVLADWADALDSN